ncbi:MAG: hypothetical protein AB7L13_21100 [Acidimicrobiia bacterium]
MNVRALTISRNRAANQGVRHALWGIVDQALSSLSNFGVSLVAVRTSGANEFGAFAVAFATYLIVNGVARSLVSDVYAVRHSGDSENGELTGRHYPFSAQALGAAACVAIVGSVACLAASAVVRGDLRNALAVLALGLPALVVQDVSRFICASRRDAVGAALLDAVWVGVFVLAVGVLVVSDHHPSALLTLSIWQCGAAASVVVAYRRFGVGANLRVGLSWFSMSFRYSVRYWIDWLALGASIQLGYYLLGATAGLAVLGDVRAGLLLIGPLNILNTGSATLAVPELARFHRSGKPGFLRLSGLLSLGLLAATACWCVLIGLFPQHAIEAALGGHAADQRPLLWVLALYGGAVALSQGPLLALRATGNVVRGTRATLPVAPLLLFGAAIGAAVINGPKGALMGSAIAALAATVSAAFQLWRAIQDEMSNQDPPMEPAKHQI